MIFEQTFFLISNVNKYIDIQRVKYVLSPTKYQIGSEYSEIEKYGFVERSHYVQYVYYLLCYCYLIKQSLMVTDGSVV